MLFRDTADGALFIPQPSHALLSGQIMAAWGALGFARPDPAPEVILAASQHDVGWMGWESEPTLNPATGRPHAFTEVAGAVHAPMWARGVELARAAWGLWPALLVSRHGSLIYRRYADPARMTPRDAEAVARYQAEQSVLQSRWADALGASPEQLERNTALVAATDALSLAACFGRAGWAGDAPRDSGSMAPLTLAGSAQEGWTLDPWPFIAPTLTLRCEVMRLPAGARWTDEAEMRRALRQAPRTQLEETLREASSGER
ncbi:DUF3891 family protein [Muricoccus radiodurans]|uniref:DUF3891 family protein n=1 Tax=Muricoccus radiodurans TaxID=2231721 RepID=UPI003CEC22C0